MKNNLILNKFPIILFIIFLGIFVTFAEAQANIIPCTLVNITNIIYSAIFIVGLMLMILGGALYAGAHIMPGQSKGTLQGYGMGMILGGIVGVIVAIFAPYIFNLITGNTISAYTSICQSTQGTLPSSTTFYVIYKGQYFSKMGINVNWAVFNNFCSHSGPAIATSSILIHYPKNQYSNTEQVVHPYDANKQQSSPGTWIGGIAYLSNGYTFCYNFNSVNPD